MENDGLLIAKGTRNGCLTLRGGTYTAPLFQQASKLVVETLASTIDAQSTFLDGGTNQLDAGLRLGGRPTSRREPNSPGAGILIVETDGTMTLEDGAVIGVDVVNRGLLSPELVAR